MALWRQMWQRIPETMRVLGILALIVDGVGVPSVVLMVMEHTTRPMMPWAAWGLVLSTGSARHAYMVAALGLLAGALYWGYSINQGGKGSHSTTANAFGSARWRTPGELAQSLGRWRMGQAQNPAGLVAGAVRARGPVREAWVLGQDGHNLLLGAPGAGKSLKVILPSLAVIAESGENLVVTDPKGELKQAMGAYLQDQGYRVVTFDLRFPQNSVRWNPLTPISRAIAGQHWADATRMANDLATILAAQGSPGGESGAFWAQSARAIGASLALLVADQAPEAARHVASMYHVLTQHGGELDALMQGLPPTHPARQAYGPLLTGSPETRQNQMSVVAISLSLFADPNIARLTGVSEWDARQLLQPRTAVFIVVPDDTTTYYPLAALFLTQMLQTLANAAASQPRGRLPVPVHMVLDEFGNLPKIPDFEKALAVARGRGVRITLTLQSLSQLDDHYGQKTAETMRNTCNTWVYLSANDPDTARVVSDKIGQTTIETTSQGQNWQTGSRQWSENTSATGRALVTMDEVLRWKPDHTLVLQMGQLPAKLPARLWFDWPQAPRKETVSASPAPPETEMESPPLWTPPQPADPDAPDEWALDPDAPLDPDVVGGWRPIV
jgi:type IV secretion system protein VirD4